MAGIVPPQVQDWIGWPIATAGLGVRVMVSPSMAASPKPRAVTVMTPAALVVMVETYFDGAEAASTTSQPQLLAPGKVSEAVVCTASVIAVRHVDAARITSDILAFFV